MITRTFQAGVVAVASAAALVAGETAAQQADRSSFHLFKPTPREMMRGMSTDRPDTTESAYTVDAGHLQIEMDFAAFTHDRHTVERDGGSESWSFATTNLKLGLTNRADLQVVVPTHTRARGGAEGFGDMEIRLKLNVWGNDGGATALALMPWVKLPTAEDDLGNDEVEGGLIVPFASEIGGGWSLGAMLEVDAIADGDGGGHHAEFLASVAAGRDIAGPLGGYVEFVSLLSTEPGSGWVASANGGLTFGISDDVQLDAGVSLGLTRAAADMVVFTGVSVRF